LYTVITSTNKTSVCHSLSRITKSNEPMSLKIGVMTGPTNQRNWLTFGGTPVPDTDSWSLFNFTHHCRIRDFRFTSISHTVTAKFLQMTDADKVINPQHFGRDLADIWIVIPDHFWLKFWHWRREHNVVFTVLVSPVLISNHLRWLVLPSDLSGLQIAV